MFKKLYAKLVKIQASSLKKYRSRISSGKYTMGDYSLEAQGERKSNFKIVGRPFCAPASEKPDFLSHHSEM